MPATPPALIADLGGTNARFALVDADQRIHSDRILPTSDFPDLAAAVAAYLHGLDVPRPRRAAMAVAAPVIGDTVRFTNSHWSFAIDATRKALGLDRLRVLNDFTALALALPLLDATERRAVGGGTAVPHMPIGLIGPGTGLGVSGLLWSGQQWVPMQTEGGQITFAAFDDKEWALASIMRRRVEQGHVVPETFLSGPGLVNLYTALAELEGWQAEAVQPSDITTWALDGRCVHCQEVFALFCALLGTAAGNLALTLGAVGGVYIGGGIVPRLGAFFDQSPFRARFEAKGRFHNYVAAIPTWVITAENPAFRGVAAALG